MANTIPHTVKSLVTTVCGHAPGCMAAVVVAIPIPGWCTTLNWVGGAGWWTTTWGCWGGGLYTCAVGTAVPVVVVCVTVWLAPQPEQNWALLASWYWQLSITCIRELKKPSCGLNTYGNIGPWWKIENWPTSRWDSLRAKWAWRARGGHRPTFKKISNLESIFQKQIKIWNPQQA